MGKTGSILLIQAVNLYRILTQIVIYSIIDKEAKLVVSQILGQIHVGSATTFCSKEPAYLIPHVDASDALVVNPVWGAVYSDTYSGNFRIKIIFRVPGACCVGHDE